MEILEKRKVVLLKRFFTDFPWLWSIVKELDPQSLEVSVKYPEHIDLKDCICLSCDELWLKIKEKQKEAMVDFPLDKISRPFNLKLIIEFFKGSLDPEISAEKKLEYIVQVNYQGARKRITIIRPPKTQIFF